MPETKKSKSKKSKGPVDIFAVGKTKTTKKKKTEKVVEKKPENGSGDEKVIVQHDDEWHDETHDEPVRQVQAKLKTTLQLKAIDKVAQGGEEGSDEENAQGDWAKKDGIQGAENDNSGSNTPTADMTAKPEEAKAAGGGRFVPIHLRGAGGSGNSTVAGSGLLNSGIFSRGPGGLRRRDVAPPKMDDESLFPSLSAAKKDQDVRLDSGFKRVQQDTRGYEGNRQAVMSGLSTANKFGLLE